MTRSETEVGFCSYFVTIEKKDNGNRRRVVFAMSAKWATRGFCHKNFVIDFHGLNSVTESLFGIDDGQNCRTCNWVFSLETAASYGDSYDNGSKTSNGLPNVRLTKVLWQQKKKSHTYSSKSNGSHWDMWKVNHFKGTTACERSEI